MLFKKNISVVTEVEFSNSFHCLCALDLQKQLGVLNFTFLVKAFMLLLNCTVYPLNANGHHLFVDVMKLKSIMKF